MIEEYLPVPVTLAVTDDKEVKHTKRLHLINLVLLVEQKEMLAAHLQHADQFTFATAMKELFVGISNAKI